VTDPDDPTDALSRVSESAAQGPVVDSSDEIVRLRNEIALRRRRLDTSLNQLEHRVSENLDWRRRVVAHPWLVMAAAALAGYAIGRLTGGRRSPEPAPRELEPL